MFLAIPVLIVFAALFSSADAIFASIASNLFGWQIDLGELPLRISVAFFVAWIVAGLLGVAAGAADLDSTAAASPDAIAWRRCGHAAGLAGRRRASAGARSAPRGDRSGDGARRRRCPVRRLRQPPGGVPVRRPRHARGRDHLRQLREARVLRARRRDLPCRWARRRPPRDRGPIGPGPSSRPPSAWPLLTFVILASAAFRLSLYQDAYGWTELRFYVDATIAWLGLGIVAAVDPACSRPDALAGTRDDGRRGCGPGRRQCRRSGASRRRRERGATARPVPRAAGRPSRPGCRVRPDSRR